MNRAYDLNSKFDIEKHKQKFVHYLEVIIDNTGAVHYAIPSHQEFLIKYICDRDNITRQELDDKCPPEYYFDFITWLCKEANCLSVWENFYYGIPNAVQLNTLKQLKKYQLYLGKI